MINQKPRRRTKIDPVEVTQGLQLEEEVKAKIEAEALKKSKKDNPQIDYDNLNKILADLLAEVEKDKTYNQVSDQISFIDKGGRKEYDPEGVALLREQNRARLAAIKTDVNNLKNAIDNALEDIDYTLQYNAKSKMQRSMMTYLSPDHVIGQANYQQQKVVKDLNTRLNDLKADVEINKFREKTKQEPIDLNDKYQDLRLLVGRWTGIALEDEDVVFTEINLPGMELKDTFILLYTSGAIPVHHVLDTNFPKVIGGIVSFWDTTEANLDSDNITEKVGLLPLQKVANDTTRSVSQIEATVNAVDEQNSYVDNVMKSPGPLNLKVKGRAYTFELSEVWENCFDCFFKSSWDKLLNFKFGLEFEIDLSGFLDMIADLIASMKFALDIPFMVKQNYCSLSRLGSLCPIELAFLLASTVALARLAWQSLIGMFTGGLLFELMALILNPLLFALSASLRFSFSPFDIYFDCVEKSIKTLQDVENALPNPTYGWTADEIAEANDKTTNTAENRTPRQSELIQKLESYKSTLSIKDKDSFKNKIERFKNLLEDAEPKPMPGGTKGAPLLVDILSTPFLMENTDMLDIVKIIPKEVQGYLMNNKFAISAGLQAIKNFSNANLVSIVQISAQLLAITSFISLLFALIELATKGIEPCIKMPVYNDKGEQIGQTLETPFTSPELIDIIDRINNSPPNTNVDLGTGLSALNSSGQSLYNPMTERRFNLVNCDKAKSSIISKGESLEFWKRVALGTNVDNV